MIEESLPFAVVQELRSFADALDNEAAKIENMSDSDKPRPAMRRSRRKVLPSYG